MKPVGLAVILASFAVLASPAAADPIVLGGPDGPQPGVASAWRTEGAMVILTVADGFDPAEVADAIAAAVPKARTRTSGDTVTVTGVREAPLLAALEKVEVEPLLDDIDSMLQALQSGDDGAEGTGSSIRATNRVALQNATFDEILGPPQARVTARVLAVQRGKFPLVLVTLRVQAAGQGSEVSKGKRITVIPRVSVQDGRIDPIDARSKLNVGAWYAQPGDRVEVKLGKHIKKRVWAVEAYRRVKTR